MSGRRRNIAGAQAREFAMRAIAFLFLLAVAGCTYSTNLEEVAYQPSGQSLRAGERIPLSAAILLDEAFRESQITYHDGRMHSVEISPAAFYVEALRQELSGLFTDVSVVDDEESGLNADVLVVADLDLERVPNSSPAEVEFRFGMVLVGGPEAFPIALLTTQQRYPLDMPGLSLGQMLLGASTFGLSAFFTESALNEEMGEAASALVSTAVSDFTRAAGKFLAKDDRLAAYLAYRKGGFDPRYPGGIGPQLTLASDPLPSFAPFVDSVVLIHTPHGLGSGFFVRPDGLIATSYHVIGGAQRLLVRQRSGRVSMATVVARAESLDLALLQIGGTGYRALPLSRDVKRSVGNRVIAVGAPKSVGWSVSVGRVTEVGEHDGVRVVATDTLLRPGDSGGPLVDVDRGEVVGINTIAMYGEGDTHMGLAMSAEDLRRAFAQHLAGR